MEQIGQSEPDSGRGIQVKARTTFEGVPYSVRADDGHDARGHLRGSGLLALPRRIAIRAY